MQNITVDNLPFLGIYRIPLFELGFANWNSSEIKNIYLVVSYSVQV